jgi:hypothetical protein
MSLPQGSYHNPLLALCFSVFGLALGNVNEKTTLSCVKINLCLPNSDVIWRQMDNNKCHLYPKSKVKGITGCNHIILLPLSTVEAAMFYPPFMLYFLKNLKTQACD